MSVLEAIVLICAWSRQGNMGEPLTVKVARVGHNDSASCLEFIE